MARKTRRKAKKAPARKRAPAKKARTTKKTRKKAPTKKRATARKKAPAKKALMKRKTISRSIPNPISTAFLVSQPAPEGSVEPDLFLIGGDETFRSDVTKAQLFESGATAQATIDGALVLAETDSPFHTAQIVKASTLLVPHYVFDLVEGEYLLDVQVMDKRDPTAEPMSFAKAKAAVAKSLREYRAEIEKKIKAFQKTWG